MMIIYVYSKCSTCQKAIRFLEQKKMVFVQKEITLTPPSVEELKKMLKYKEGNIRKLFNTSGLLYKEMQLSQKLDEMSLDEAFNLLHKNGMLVKRPFVIASTYGLTGFSEKEWSEKMHSST